MKSYTTFPSLSGAYLLQQNAAISNIEVTDGNIKSFERTANKYGIDYALKKDTSEQPPRYLVLTLTFSLCWALDCSLLRESFCLRDCFSLWLTVLAENFLKGGVITSTYRPLMKTR